MRRQHPFISLTGILLTILFLLGLGVSIWMKGGLAFSPGYLSAVGMAGVNLGGFTSHAEFEGQCGRCHAPLQTSQDELCLACHTSIRAQIVSSEGYHAQIDVVERCADCHPEHKGSAYDPGQAALKYFDHEQVAFSLVGHQVDYDGAPIICTSCHIAEGRYADATIKHCTTCHGVHDAQFMVEHIDNYGSSCMECHDGHDRMLKFDHNSTIFPLVGKHVAVDCAGCHAKSGRQKGGGWSGSFQDLSMACSGCHSEPQVHMGVFDSKCENCHTEQGWVPAGFRGKVFEHASSTGFSLAHHLKDYDGQPLSCTSCHGSSLTSLNTKVCKDCHSKGDEKRAEFMRLHIEQYGESCQDCHDGVDRMTNFDHQQVFPLGGVHGEIECKSCHKDRIYQGTPKECVQCHVEPAIHAGVFGVSCQDCHTTQAWTPARLQVHKFPLSHGAKDDVACTVCHVNTYTSYTCYGCHEHQPGPIEVKHIEEKVPLRDLPDCAGCHPNGK